jgi:nucleoside-diphosphate-sugar epimerase
MGESLCAGYASEYQVPVVTARLAQTFGYGMHPNDRRIFAQIIQSAKKKSDIILHTKGDKVYNFCYLSDVATALFTLLSHGKAGESYNIVNTDEKYTILSMAEMVASTIMHDEIKVVVKENATISSRYPSSTHWALSDKKLKALGWQSHVGLVEALRENIL